MKALITLLPSRYLTVVLLITTFFVCKCSGASISNETEVQGEAEAGDEFGFFEDNYDGEEAAAEGIKGLPGFPGSPGSSSGLPKRRCQAGNYHKHDDFFGEVTNTFIFDNPDLFVPATMHCAMAFMSYGFMTEKCACDCFFEHGASDSAACVLDLQDLNRAPIGCACLYTEEDRKRVPCLEKKPSTSSIGGIGGIGGAGGAGGGMGNFNLPPKKQRILQESRLSKCERLPSDKQRQSCLKEICDPAYNEMKMVVCGKEEYTLENNQTLNGVELCAIDCYYIHGSKKQPYGVCQESQGRSICACLY